MSNPFTGPFNSSSGTRRRRASRAQEDPFGGLPGPDFFANESPRAGSSRPPPASYRGPPPSSSWGHSLSGQDPFGHSSSSHRRGSSAANLPGPEFFYRPPGFGHSSPLAPDQPERRRRSTNRPESLTADLPGPDVFTSGSGSSNSRYPPPTRYAGSGFHGMASPSSHRLPPMDTGIRRPSSSSARRTSSITQSDPSPRLPRPRRGAVDLSAQAFDPYDPLAGELRRSWASRRDSDGDATLPRYRSASAYARDPGGLPPAYGEVGGGASQALPPPRYNSTGGRLDSGGPSPRQYPATRRPSAYGQRGTEPDLGYYVQKWADGR